MTVVTTLEDYADEGARVIQAFLKGETNTNTLARELEIPRTRVVQHIEEFRKIAASDENVREMARASVVTLVQHFDILIKDLHNNSEEMRNRNDFKGSTAALVAAGNLEAKRQEALQKAGLYDDAGMADEVMRLRELMDKYKALLVSIASKNPVVKVEIQEGLREIYGQAPPVPVKPAQPPVKGEVVQE